MHIAIISSSVPLCFWCQRSWDCSFPIWLYSIITSIEGAITLSGESSKPPVGHWDVWLLPVSFTGLWGIMHYYSWLVLAGIKAQGLLYFYTLPPPKSPRWNQPWTRDCHWPIEKDRKRERDRERQKERKPTLLIPMHRPFPFSCKLIQGLEENFKKQAITRAWLVFVLPIIHYNLASVLQTVIIGLTASFPCRNTLCTVTWPCFWMRLLEIISQIIGPSWLHTVHFAHLLIYSLLISSWKL